jgi:quercetin dioxygenase-like cupin family protein
MLARTTTPAEANTFAVSGATVLPIAADADTGGAWEAFVLDLAPGAASPLHTLSADKAFHVLGGTVVITLDADEAESGAGSTAHVPAGTPHRYQNRSGAPARLLVITTGSGQLAFLAGMSRLSAGGPPDPAALTAHTRAHGVRLLART